MVVDTASLAAIPASELRKSVVDLQSDSAAIQDALDTLFGTY